MAAWARRHLRDVAFFVFGMSFYRITWEMHHASIHSSTCNCQQQISPLQMMEDCRLALRKLKPLQDVTKERIAAENGMVKLVADGTAANNLTMLLLTLWRRIPKPTATAKIDNNITYHHQMANQAATVFLVSAQKPRPKHDVVLITQGGANKFHNLLIMIRWWSGPVDVAMYFKSPDEILLFESFIDSNQAQLQQVNFHVLLEKGTEVLPYPNNLLRNLVLDNLREDYYVALDVDFIPNKGAYKAMYNLIHNNNAESNEIKKRLHAKEIFVLPAFDLIAPPNVTFYATEDMLPQTKSQLLELREQKKLKQFRAGGGGHKPTNYFVFYNDNADGTAIRKRQYKEFWELQYDGCGTYEPYILGYRHGAPRYWKELRSGYMNKVSYFKEMSRAGFQYNQLQHFWVVHMIHPRIPEEAMQIYSAYNKPHWNEFTQYFRSWYPLLNCTWGQGKDVQWKMV